MSKVSAIHCVPDDASFLKIFREAHVGEWVSAAQICKEVMWGGLCGDADLQTVSNHLGKLDTLARKGLLEAGSLNSLQTTGPGWIRLDGQLINAADPISMGPLMRFDFARKLAVAYRITTNGKKRISYTRHAKPALLTVAISATTACSSLKNTETQIVERRVIESQRQIYQDRDSTGRIVWSYCENDCPVATPKVMAFIDHHNRFSNIQKQETPTPRLEPTKSQKAEVVTETTKASLFFKINSSAVANADKNKMSSLLAGGYSWQKVTVTGRADPIGGSAFNHELSRKRAQEVVSLLVAAGVPRESITQEVKVELSRAANDVITIGQLPSRIEHQSRRVDVELVRIKSDAGQKQ